MADFEVFHSFPFLSELSWARDTILKLREYKVKGKSIGFSADLSQPDELFGEFALRGLMIEPYVAGFNVALGSPEAYMHNIAAIASYIARRRQIEIQSAHEKIREILSLKAQSWPIGLSPADGRPDAIATYFAVRGLPIAFYARGRVNIGDESAYDKSVVALKEYVAKVADALVR